MATTKEPRQWRDVNALTPKSFRMLHHMDGLRRQTGQLRTRDARRHRIGVHLVGTRGPCQHLLESC